MRIDEAGEAEDVAGEIASAVKQAFKPAHVRADQFYHISDIEHGEQCTRTDNVPHPPAEKYITAYHGKDDQGGVYDNLYLGEIQSAYFAYGYLDSFAWHSDRTAQDFSRYSESHDRTSGKLREYLHRQRAIVDKRCEIHVDVDERTEHEADHKLKQLPMLERTHKETPNVIRNNEARSKRCCQMK